MAVKPSDEIPSELIRALTSPDAYPGDPGARHTIETIQTHISYLYLTPDRVYKLRKAVTLPFLSFATRSKRNADCLLEVALNRRLAPDVYLGVAPISQSANGHWEVGTAGEALSSQREAGEPLEHCVVMRRLAVGRDAGSLLRDGKLSKSHVDAVADMLAAFHDASQLGTPAPYPAEEWLTRQAALVTDCIDLARNSGCDRLDPAELERDGERLLAMLATRRALFEKRLQEGRLAEGHGDLRLEHVFFETDDAEPIAIDCVEFDPLLRRIDCAAEVAFFAMDLIYREHPLLAERFLARYAAVRDDFQLYGVVDYYIAHRALVRAGVAGVASMEEELGPAGRSAAAASSWAHARLARNVTAAHGQPSLVLTCGTVGTGKSTVAAELAEMLAGAVISSDRTRKHLAHLAPTTHVHAAAGEGIYDAESTQRVYRGLLERADPVLVSGRTAVLDATWSKKAARDEAIRWCRERSITPLLVEVRCDESIALERLAQRELEPDRVSDAGPSFLRQSLRHFEPPVEWPRADHCVVRTDRSDWRETLRAALEVRGQLTPRTRPPEGD